MVVLDVTHHKVSCCTYVLLFVGGIFFYIESPDMEKFQLSHQDYCVLEEKQMRALGD